MRYYIIAGEASGDLHGANLMKGLLRHDPSCDIRFWGGGKMAAVGGTLVKDYRDNAVMGFVEVLSHLGSILRNLRFCKEDILQYRPDAVILIDYPGFNLKIARFAHEKGFKVFYYIPPKVWARGESRIRLLKKYVDKVFIIFPFEVGYFKAKGVDAVYNGNPLVDNIGSTPSVHLSREDFLRTHSLTDDGRPLLAPVTFSMTMGEKLLFTGFNGVGKSTLIKSILKKIPALSGTATFSPSAKINYFDQDLVWDDPSLTPLQTIQNMFPTMQPRTIRTKLARAGINAANTMKPLHLLSGGEQTKVKLAILELTPCNFLIMDEPTNHLDDETKDGLKQALQEFPGNLILVSHEESFYTGWLDKILNVEKLSLKS